MKSQRIMQISNFSWKQVLLNLLGWQWLVRAEYRVPFYYMWPLWLQLSHLHFCYHLSTTWILVFWTFIIRSAYWDQRECPATRFPPKFLNCLLRCYSHNIQIIHFKYIINVTVFTAIIIVNFKTFSPLKIIPEPLPVTVYRHSPQPWASIYFLSL